LAAPLRTGKNPLPDLQAQKSKERALPPLDDEVSGFLHA
jgi:hypothetical protein